MKLITLSEHQRPLQVSLFVELIRSLFDFFFIRSNVPLFSPFKEPGLALLHYSMDILYAKSDFPESVSKFKWLTRSFSNLVFVKFMFVYIVQVVMSHSFVGYIRSLINKTNNMFKTYKYYNVVVTWAVNLVLLGPLVYFLKFKWAYEAQTTKSLDKVDVMIMTWIITLVTIFSLFQTINNTIRAKCGKKDSVDSVDKHTDIVETLKE
jgi:hypothetical protein